MTPGSGSSSGSGPILDVPAVCATCGNVYPSGFAMVAGTTTDFFGNAAGNCPIDGGPGFIPDGLYEAVGETLRLVSAWSPQRREALVAALEVARNAPDARTATVKAIQKAGLPQIANRLLIPRNAGEFWALVAAICTVIALIQSMTDEHVTERTVHDGRARNGANGH
jgi:hypothetical protein